MCMLRSGCNITIIGALHYYLTNIPLNQWVNLYVSKRINNFFFSSENLCIVVCVPVSYNPRNSCDLLSFYFNIRVHNIILFL